MAGKKKRKNKRSKGCGIGPHHEVSPMGHATRTPSKAEKIEKLEKKNKGRDSREE